MFIFAKNKMLDISALVIILFILITIYHDIFIWLYGRYVSSDSYYSHGFIIPIISGFLIWQKRAELKNMPVTSTTWGLIIILIAVLMHISGVIIYVYSLSGLSLFFMILGLSLYIFGKERTRTVIFPLVFLIFMFPIPQAMIEAISFPMKMLVAKMGVDILSFCGMSVFREGFNISIPSGSLLVGNPCSGLRSLISFLALGSILSYIIDLKLYKKITLVFLTIPIALLFNILRVLILILISYFYGVSAASPETLLHSFSGVFTFALGFLILLYIGKLLE
jgi:exosortase